MGRVQKMREDVLADQEDNVFFFLKRFLKLNIEFLKDVELKYMFS